MKLIPGLNYLREWHGRQHSCRQFVFGQDFAQSARPSINTNFGTTGETGWGESLVDTLMMESDGSRSLFYINRRNCVDL